MSNLDKGRVEKNNSSDKDRPLPPEIEWVRQRMGVDVLGMWADIYKAAGAEEAAVPSYRRFVREGYVPAAVRIFCEQYEEKERASRTVTKDKRSLPKSFIMGKAAIIPPEAPDEKKS